MAALDVGLQLILAIAALILAVRDITAEFHHARLVLSSMTLEVRLTAECAIAGGAQCPWAVDIVFTADLIEAYLYRWLRMMVVEDIGWHVFAK